VRLNAEECWERLVDAEHGVLATSHPERGVDAVPVVFAVDGRTILLPVDTVKAKSTTALQRLANLERDPRCVLLVDHYDADWSRLWWVRVHGTAAIDDGGDVAPLLRFAQYRAPGAISAVLRLRPAAVTGWSA
jgi:PPOX class probable F420-dependent enzyme